MRFDRCPSQGRTIDSQLEALTRRILDDGCVTGPDLRFVDDGYSGSTLIRPALERLRDLAALGGFDRLYVHSPDRLARAYVYQMLLVDDLRRGLDPLQTVDAAPRTYAETGTLPALLEKLSSGD